MVVTICESIFYIVLALSCVVICISFILGLIKPSKSEIELEKQTDLLSKIDVTLIGIDCRLRSIEEKNSGG